MKGQISRDSYRPHAALFRRLSHPGRHGHRRRSRRAHRIVTARTDLLGDDTIKDGVPAIGGAVAIAAPAIVSLREGVIYADGVRGVLSAVDGADLATPLAIFTQQADLPLGPALPAADSVIYADIWERAGLPAGGPLPRRCRPARRRDGFPHAHHDAAQGGAARRRARHRDRHRRLPADRHRRACGDAAQPGHHRRRMRPLRRRGQRRAGGRQCAVAAGGRCGRGHAHRP